MGFFLVVESRKAQVTQSCPTLCDPMGYTVHGILQARILEWVAIPFSRGLSDPGMEPRSPTLQADSSPSEPPGKPLIVVHSLLISVASLVAELGLRGQRLQ